MIEDVVRSAVLQSLQNDRRLEEGPTSDRAAVDRGITTQLLQPSNVSGDDIENTVAATSTSLSENTEIVSNEQAPGPVEKPKRRRGPTPDANWTILQAQIGAASKKRGRDEEVIQGNARHFAGKVVDTGKDPNVTDNFSAFMPRPVRPDANATNVVALDCEMVGVGPEGRKDALARVSVVNYAGDVLYDTFVKPGEAVTDYRTRWSGVRAEDVSDDSCAVDLYEAQEVVGQLLKGRIVVGHAIKNDFRVLKIAHPWHRVRDTADFYKRIWKRRGQNRPALRTLVAQVLGIDTFQKSEHDSCEDARAALALYKKNAKEWEKLISEHKTGKSKKRSNK